jgi:hypothetical protein
MKDLHTPLWGEVAVIALIVLHHAEGSWTVNSRSIPPETGAWVTLLHLHILLDLLTATD